jgi:hypothetical protein
MKVIIKPVTEPSGSEHSMHATFMRARNVEASPSRPARVVRNRFIFLNKNFLFGKPKKVGRHGGWLSPKGFRGAY